MTAQDAIAELLEVSPQIQATVLATLDGEPISSSVPAGTSDTTLAAFGRDILARAELARVELGREPVVQCEIATGDAHVFVVTDAERFIVATTGPEPTVGLVFYDLKTALRTVRENATSANGKAAR